jgi:DNA-binding SARP family transcriptional activator
LFQKALKLYKGDFLQDNLYEEWASRDRERLLNLYLRTADALCTLYAEKQDWNRVVELCQSILSRDPCWEAAYRQTMTAYLTLGNKPAALRAYHKCVETLNNELGIKPSITTQKLYEQLFPNPPVF